MRYNLFHGRLELIVCIRDHQNITNGTKYWTKLSVQYDTTKIYVASFATEVLLDEGLRDGQLGTVIFFETSNIHLKLLLFYHVTNNYRQIWFPN